MAALIQRHWPDFNGFAAAIMPTYTHYPHGAGNRVGFLEFE